MRSITVTQNLSITKRITNSSTILTDAALVLNYIGLHVRMGSHAKVCYKYAVQMSISKC